MTDQNFNDEAAAEENFAMIDEMNTTGSNDQVTSSHILCIKPTHSFTSDIVILHSFKLISSGCSQREYHSS